MICPKCYKTHLIITGAATLKCPKCLYAKYIEKDADNMCRKCSTKLVRLERRGVDKCPRCGYERVII